MTPEIQRGIISAEERARRGEQWLHTLCYGTEKALQLGDWQSHLHNKVAELTVTEQDVERLHKINNKLSSVQNILKLYLTGQEVTVTEISSGDNLTGEIGYINLATGVFKVTKGRLRQAFHYAIPILDAPKPLVELATDVRYRF